MKPVLTNPDRIYLTRLTVEKADGQMLSYDTNIEGWTDIKTVAKAGADAAGRKILLMQVLCRNQGSIWSHAPEQLAALP